MTHEPPAGPTPSGLPPEPGEQPPYQPYGSGPPAGSPYGAGPSPAASTDAVSITGFVLSLLCCTSVVGLVLGIIGIGRTRDGVRNGRWAAVSAIVVGALGTLACLGLVGFFVWFGTSTVLLSNAEPGQCVDVDEIGDGPDATLFEKDCNDDHEAEIVASGSFDGDEAARADPGDPGLVCDPVVDPDYADALASGDYDLGIVYESDDPDAGDDFACYLERSDGRDLTEPIAAG